MDRISIPSATPSVAHEAADIAIATLRSCGADPRKILGVPLAVEVVRSWGHGEMTDADFRRSIRNLLILNPNLKG